ncbi:hypothetical protein Taro_011094 [Colocasia esculenta]|uniref:Geranylgeranyl transferase type-2 subunit alpha n=1 Tax=Colocasia esculenta TaxID=4460 RepID=A0A843U5D9_COLES|nr:hypothetical protein [Colocasia esculenta]
MHGRPRRPARAEDAEAAAAKAEKLRSLQSQLLHNHHHRIYDKEAVEASARLLEANPEVYTAWNYRKVAVQSRLGSGPGPEELKSIVDQELKIAEIALRRNPKCYGAWHHRKWVMKLGSAAADFDNEFRLLDQLLKLDSRNFHGWNHRRFVAALKNVPEEEELKFTTDMINKNFSNYSAWHNRSVILSHLMKQKAPGFASKEEVLSEEFELIHQALFTDPDDQSGWFYHLWLLDQTVAVDVPLLVSSWPSHGSEIVISRTTYVEDCKSCQYTYNVPHTKEFPIVLYFNQVVKGVNSTTVTVECEFSESNDLIWKPLSTSNSAEAHAWVTYVKIPDANFNSPRGYLVKVFLGRSPGLISSSGHPFSSTSQFGFILNGRSHGSECIERDCDVKVVDWSDDNFCSSESLLQNLAVSFDQLRIVDGEPMVSKWHSETLSNEITLFQQLMSEINCKISKLTLARLLIAHDVIISRGILPPGKKTHFEETLQLYDDLIKSDSSHTKYYQDQRSLVLLDQLTSDKESMAKHCRHHKELASTSVSDNVCVRFNGLSLARMGFVHRLLWVRMLDLSHNELQSIEGLEAMQLLSHLNLGTNKISSITALEPLKMMKSLKVLDISYNEIGAHSIDTTRYLCASPLSHTTTTRAASGSVEEPESFDVSENDFWETILVFKYLHLTQLNVVGNPVSSESFSALLIKLIPSLQWLDGRHVQRI